MACAQDAGRMTMINDLPAEMGQWTIQDSDMRNARYAIEQGLAYASECLAVCESLDNHSRGLLKNQVWEQRIKSDMARFAEALGRLPLP